MTARTALPFDRQVLVELEVTPQGDATTERRERAERLTTIADGRRQPLEDLRLVYLQRLQRASGDLAATEAIRTVDLALMLLPRPGRAGMAGQAGAGRRARRRGRDA